MPSRVPRPALARALPAIALLLALSPALHAAPERARRDGPKASEGRLVVLQEDDFARGRSRLLHELVTDDGRRLRLLGVDAAPRGFASGARVRVVGRDVAEGIEVAQAPGSLVVLAAAAAVAGERRSIVLLVDFANAAVSCSTAQVAGLLFEGARSVDGLYRESSWDRLRFPGDGDGDGSPDVFRVSIDDTIAGCNPVGWAAAADEAARDAGLALDAAQHVLYVLPSATGCVFAGLATVGCPGVCRAWVKSCGTADVYAHELGHNLGLWHASTDANNDGLLDSEYGDLSDVMGIGGVGWRQHNGPHKERLGWLPAGQVIGPEEAGSTVALAALETDPLATAWPQLLRWPGAGGEAPYYLSYRTRVGYDDALHAGWIGGVSIHRWAGENSIHVATLADGETFSDEAAGLSVTQLAHDGSMALVALGGQSEPPPPAPLGVTARTTGKGRVRIDWQPVSGAVRYRVWRDGALRGETDAPPLFDLAAERAPSAVYRVSAVDASGRESSESLPAEVEQARDPVWHTTPRERRGGG